MLKLPHRWVWDWWLADTGSEYHLFFLQAPRSLGRQILRHRSATVGHAVSTDLREWQTLPTVLVPGPRGAWDDVATWTGSTLWHDGPLAHLLHRRLVGREGARAACRAGDLVGPHGVAEGCSEPAHRGGPPLV